jgi:peptidoglycan/LPS O-acetylase OafA/YrhL
MTVYRRDIDGLRAVAVMGVILHHAGVGRVHPGFAGVDVFFVISGFLIGGIIASERAEGRFSWRRFYARRARRILPALFVVILVSLAVGWGMMTPDQLRYFAGGALATLMFVSNVWFYNRIDYFNPAAAEDPLIHTWSLAVEEQFYIALPILLLLLWRGGPRVVLGSLAGLAVLSFGLAALLGPERPTATFYLIQTRAWELLAGVIAALVFDRVQLAGRTGPVLATMGLGLVVAGIMFIPAAAVWPGPWTMVPVLGAALVMLYGHHASVGGWLLRLAPVVALGVISYSAYLWHQPILGFLAIAGQRPDSAVEIAAVVAATLSVAAVSWRLIEQPFRHGLAGRPLGQAALWIAGLAIAGFAVGGHVTEGYPSRVPAEVRAVLAWSDSVPETYERCIGGRKETERLDPAVACILGAPGVAPTVALWGDSHSAVLAQPLGALLERHGIALRELSASSCMPVGGVRNTALKRAEYCAIHNRLMLDHMVADPDLRVVVIFAFWNSYVESRDFDNRAGAVVQDVLVAVPTDAADNMPDVDRITALTRLLRADVQELVAAGKQVVILEPLPQPGFNLPDRLARDLWLGLDPTRHESYPEAAFADYSEAAQEMLAAAAAGLQGVRVLDLSSLFCTPVAECRVVADGKPLFHDANHLSLAGSAMVVPSLADAVRSALAGGGD